jgi:hypothetical protein
MKKIILLITSISFMSTYSQVGINTANPKGIFHVDGSKDNPATGIPTAGQQANDFVVTTNGSVGIGTNTPNASAILDVNVDGLASGNKKGFLGPKAALSSQTDQLTIPTPATGLLVYNLGTGGLIYNGYVFWNGSEWRSLNNSSLSTGVIGGISCNSVTLSPSTYISGAPYVGTMNVPYTGGNGGVYTAQSIGPVNGLTANLSSGNFNSGSGTLSYAITGTPTVSSPVTTAFSLNIGGKTCGAVIGGGDVIAPGELQFYKGVVPHDNAHTGSGNQYSTQAQGMISTYLTDLPVIGGKLRLDAYFYGLSGVSLNPRLVNTSSNPVRVSFSSLSSNENFDAGNYVIAAGGKMDLDNGIFGNVGGNNVTSGGGSSTSSGLTQNANEIVTLDLAMDGKWYRVYYNIIINNNDTVITTDDYREIFISVQRLN